MDNDAFDRAFDAAEAKLAEMEDTDNSPIESEEPNSQSVTETQAEDLAVKEATNDDSKPKEVSQDKTSKRKKNASVSKDSKNAAPTQKAAKETEENNLSGQEADAENPEGVAQEDDSQGTDLPIEIPTFWPAEMKEAVAKGSKEDVVSHFSKYDQQRTEWANRIATEGAEGRAVKKRLDEGFASVRDEAIANGINTPLDELERYRAFDRILKRDPNKFLSDLGRKNGITPEEYAAAYYGDERESYQSEQYKDPRVDEALNEIKSWKEEQEQKSLQTEIDTFKKGSDSAGNERKAFAEAYAPQIDQAYQAISRMSEYGSLSMQDKLSHAYEYVLTEARKLHGVVATAKKPVEKIDPVAQAKKVKAAASSLTGGPSSGVMTPRPRAKTIDEALDRAEEQLGIR